jgi:thiol-disulfide isomerase/thioredoxin
MMRHTTKLRIATLGLCLLIGFWLFSQRHMAPDVTFTTLYGKAIKMHDLRGKVVLVNFWATDCVTCNNEMPDLVHLYDDYKNKGFEVIAIAMPYDPPGLVVRYIQQKQLPFPVTHDAQADLLHRFSDVAGTPTTYLYDKRGKLLLRVAGKLDFATLRRSLDKELS